MKQFREAISTRDAPRPLGLYSQAMRTRSSDLVFVAGQVAVDLDGNLVGEGDAGAQTRQVLENIGRVLTAAGASLSNVVEFTTYVVGRESIQPFIEARTGLFREMFPDGDYPPNTLLVVDGLVKEEFLIEIKAVAVVP